MDIRLQVWSNGHHLQQAYAGLSWLASEGKIKLTQEIIAGDNFSDNNLPPHIRQIHLFCFRLVINNAISVVFDLHDSFELSPTLVKTCDLYVKRSYWRSYISDLGMANKVIPYGPFYEVYTNAHDFKLAARSLSIKYEWRRRMRSVLRASPLFDKLTSCPREHKLSHTVVNKSGKVLFSVNVHDPYDDPSRQQHKVEERILLIEERAELIRKLKNELGANFVGGIKCNSTAKKFAPDCILPDAGMFSKENYIKTLKSVSIGIASTGLHNSVGGKFGEYVACGKGIVCSTMVYDQGEGVDAGKNYMVGCNTDEIVESVVYLL